MISSYFTATILSRNATLDRTSYYSDPDQRSCRDTGLPPAPIALLVCLGSRELALERYCPALEAQNTEIARAPFVETSI